MAILNKELLLSLLTADGGLKDSNIELTHELGSINVLDAEFRGRRTSEDGSEYILLHLDDSKMPKSFTLQKGCPSGCNEFRLSRWVLRNAYTDAKGNVYPAGHASYRAYGVVVEVEED